MGRDAIHNKLFNLCSFQCNLSYLMSDGLETILLNIPGPISNRCRHKRKHL